MDNMKIFWDKVNALLPTADRHDGYIEVCAEGKIYRSLEWDHGTVWVCWKPYMILHHFTEFNDVNATVKWVEGERVTLC